MTLDEVFKKYQAIQSAPFNPFSHAKLFDNLPQGTKKYKEQLIKRIQATINNQEPEDLRFYLAVVYCDGIDKDYKPLFKQLILSTWHNEHETLVDLIYELKDDDFTDDLYKIAVTPEPYRKWDDELEATLRKCVHALKAINSTKANKRLKELKLMGNDNVRYALEMYD